MSNWLQRIEPVIFHQSSDIPYVILKSGVLLCFDNLYLTDKCSPDAYNLSFRVERNQLKRVSTYWSSFVEFPAVIPFKDVIRLNDTVIGGKIIRYAQSKMSDSKSIAIVTSRYIDGLNEKDFSAFIEAMESYDITFLKIGADIISDRVRLLDDYVVSTIDNGWSRLLVSVADKMCPLVHRKYCWTKSVPEVAIDCYGLENTDETCEIHQTLSSIGVPEFSVNWAS